jgi:hypothetical protein
MRFIFGSRHIANLQMRGASKIATEWVGSVLMSPHNKSLQPTRSWARCDFQKQLAVARLSLVR